MGVVGWAIEESTTARDDGDDEDEDEDEDDGSRNAATRKIPIGTSGGMGGAGRKQAGRRLRRNKIGSLVELEEARQPIDFSNFCRTFGD